MEKNPPEEKETKMVKKEIKGKKEVTHVVSAPELVSLASVITNHQFGNSASPMSDRIGETRYPLSSSRYSGLASLSLPCVTGSALQSCPSYFPGYLGPMLFSRFSILVLVCTSSLASFQGGLTRDPSTPPSEQPEPAVPPSSTKMRNHQQRPTHFVRVLVFSGIGLHQDTIPTILPQFVRNC